MPSTRKLLLDVLASFDAETPEDVCSDALDEIFNSRTFTDDALSDESCHGGVNPLMVACDKSIASALNYLKCQIQQHCARELLVWGRVTDKAPESGNCAAHHALAANFRTGVDVLEYYALSESPSSDQNNLQRYMTLLEQPNENGDTPIMMACVYGHSDMLIHILKRSFYLASTADTGLDTDVAVMNVWQSLRKLFEKRNEEGCSALNLACGHGHIDIVRLLIDTHLVYEKQDTVELHFLTTDDFNEMKSNENDVVHKLMPLVTVNYDDDVRRSQSTIGNLEVGLKMMKQNRVASSKQEEFQQQHNNAMKCLELLNVELGRIAAETATSLLTHVESQDQSYSAKKKTNGKATKKKKKSKKKQQKQAPRSNEIDIESATTEHTTQSEKNGDVWCVETQSHSDADFVGSTATSPFITLQDGRVISKSQTQDVVPCEDDPVDNLMHVSPTPKTLESVLQSNSRYDDNTATMMESLCLDPSMLLLSAHGMAMETSPCQLDTIETILTNQLRASKEARKIQSRLLNNK